MSGGLSLTFVLFIIIFLWELVTSPMYNVTFTQISLEGNPADLEFTAIFDTGTSFTYLNDPAYTQISESVSNEVHYLILSFMNFNFPESV